MRVTATLLVLAATAIPAFAQSEASALKKFRITFARLKPTEEHVREKTEAIESLEPFDSPAVVEELIDAYGELEKEATPLETKRHSLLRRGGGTSELAWLRAKAQPIRNLQAKLITSLDRRSRPDSVREMVASLIRSKNPSPLTLQLALARRAGDLAGGDVSLVLERVEGRHGDDELLVLLSTLARLGERAKPAAQWATALLAHDTEEVRVEAVNALGSLGWHGSIEPMVARMERERGRTLERFVHVLRALTGEAPGPTAESWKLWLDAEGGPWVRGEIPLGKVSPVEAKERQENPESTGTYFGIPQDGNAVLYVFDCSKSMEYALNRDKKPIDGDEPDRIHVCRQEMHEALSKLGSSKTFNIIAFANKLQMFSSKMQKASKNNIAKAHKWVDGVALEFQTNTYDALDLAFLIAGRGAADRYYPVVADTIFLVSDGRPYVRNVGQRPGEKRKAMPDPNDEILAAVRRWNPYQRLVIHAIGLGLQGGRFEQEARSFLANLADQNGGRFVERRE